MTQVICPGLRLNVERFGEFNEVMTLDLAAVKIGYFVFLDLREHLRLGSSDFALRLADVPINDVREHDIVLSIKSARFGQFRFPTREPRPGGLFAIESLRLAMND